jgi:hypothetical protein
MKRLLVLSVLLIGLVAPLMPSHDSAAQEPTTMAQLREIVGALFAGDAARIEGLLRFTSVPCVAESLGIGSPPVCRKGEPEGTAVEVFPAAVCEGFYLRRDEMQSVIDALANAGPEVVAVYRFETPSADAFFYGEFVAVATIGGAPPPQNAGGVFIGEGGITGLARGCAQTAEEFAQFWSLTEQVDLGEAPATPTATAQPTAPPTATVAATALPPTGFGQQNDGTRSSDPPLYLALAALTALALMSVAIALLRQTKA